MENYKKIVSSDLSDFGIRELIEVEKLIKALRENGLPYDFDNENLTIFFNRNSGFVFFTNSQNQNALCSEGKLEEYFTCVECSNEGLLDEICDNIKTLICNSCGKNIKGD